MFWCFGFVVILLLVIPSESISNVPSICVSVLVRNKEHSLPYFLHALEKIRYPKENMRLWIALDHSVDKSSDIIDKWLVRVNDLYHQITYMPKFDVPSYPNEKSPTDWTPERMKHVMTLKMAAMEFCMQANSEYLFYLDADAILVNPDVLHHLISLNLPIVSPMLNTTAMYTNFWGGMASNGYYKRSEDYFSIRNRHKQGVFKVPLVHSAILVNLKHSKSNKLSFMSSSIPGEVPEDDIIIFAFSARQHDIDMFIVNDAFYGYLPVPREPEDGLLEEVLHWRELVSSKTSLLEIDNVPEPFAYDLTKTTKLEFDEIYVINLLRRPERGESMKRVLRLFDIGYRHFAAVDGQTLNSSYLDDLGVKMLEGYLDPYYKRPLKMGEIGCFLSHYFIWKDMIQNGYQRILILEDDAAPVPDFNDEMIAALRDADRFVPDWELLYVGRKILRSEHESYVSGSSHLIYPDYSYWTVGYALTLSGATKLVEEKPLGKMVAVDEYLPIMFDKNDNTEWLSHFYKRDIVAISVNPLIVYPQLYTYEDGHFSDTEASEVVDAVDSSTSDYIEQKLTQPESKMEL